MPKNRFRLTEGALDGQTVDADEWLPCAFCAGKFAIGVAESGDQAVIHTHPPCQVFIELEPLEFMTESVDRTLRGPLN